MRWQRFGQQWGTRGHHTRVAHAPLRGKLAPHDQVTCCGRFPHVGRACAVVSGRNLQRRGRVGSRRSVDRLQFRRHSLYTANVTCRHTEARSTGRIRRRVGVVLCGESGSARDRVAWAASCGFVLPATTNLREPWSLHGQPWRASSMLCDERSALSTPIPSSGGAQRPHSHMYVPGTHRAIMRTGVMRALARAPALLPQSAYPTPPPLA